MEFGACSRGRGRNPLRNLYSGRRFSNRSGPLSRRSPLPCQQSHEVSRIQEKSFKNSTIFVENIPSKASWKWVESIYRDIGWIREIVIPNKLSRSGKRFGFVSFNSEQEACKAKDQTSERIFAGHKFRVEMATIKKNASNRTINPPSKRDFPVSIEVNSQKKWEKSIIGRIRDRDQANSLQEIINEKCPATVKLSRIAMDHYVISIQNEESRISLEKENWGILRSWFSHIQPWSPEFVPSTRTTEVQIWNLPLIFWNKINISGILAKWGMINSFLGDLDNPIDARICNLLIETAKPNRIEGQIFITHKNSRIPIYVRETGYKLVQESYEKETSPDVAVSRSDSGEASPDLQLGFQGESRASAGSGIGSSPVNLNKDNLVFQTPDNDDFSAKVPPEAKKETGGHSKKSYRDVVLGTVNPNGQNQEPIEVRHNGLVADNHISTANKINISEGNSLEGNKSSEAEKETKVVGDKSTTSVVLIGGQNEFKKRKGRYAMDINRYLLGSKIIFPRACRKERVPKKKKKVAEFRGPSSDTDAVSKTVQKQDESGAPVSVTDSEVQRLNLAAVRREEAKNTWEIGKKLGFRYQNEEEIIREIEKIQMRSSTKKSLVADRDEAANHFMVRRSIS